MEITRRTFLGGGAAALFVPVPAWGAAASGVAPWEKPDGTAADAVMVRRLYLDLAGRIPTMAEAKAYVEDADPGKRAALVERLLRSCEYANYWTMRLCDLLRVKSEFPINLWPNAVYAYHRRIHEFVKNDEPWDDFGRALLTSQGSDFRDAEVNFFRAAVSRDPEGWSDAAAQTFLGVGRDRLPARTRAEFDDAFAGVRIKGSREWKEEIVYVEGADRRMRLCATLFGRMRGDVERAFLRRVDGWLFGDDATLAGDGSSLRLKETIRSAVMSPEYAAGSVTGAFPARRLDAEVLDDALCSLSGEVRDYQSPAPEPFSFLPPDRSTVSIEDGSVSSGFLTLFGRPARDTGLASERRGEVTAKQRLALFNSAKLHRQLGRVVSPPGFKGKHPPFERRVEDLYWRILSRAPSGDEAAAVKSAWELRRKRPKPNQYAMLRDVAWCLVNSKEFLFRV